MESILDRVVHITNGFVVERGHPIHGFVATPSSAVCQDAYIYGVDVDDYVCALEAEFGDVVRLIPWLHYTDQTASFRGWATLWAPVWVIWRLVRKMFVGGHVIPRPSPASFSPRLELVHIAKVIEEGDWSVP